MIRIIALAAGLCGACVTSQAPEFTQQYQQRLAGQVDALTSVVLDFDESALAAGLGREEALSQMVGTPFLEAHQTDMRATFARHAVLSDTLRVLRTATPLEQLAMPLRFTDVDTASATWRDFAPAVPLTLAGAVSAAVGGTFGWLGALGLLSICTMPFRRRARQAPVATPRRQEPVVVRPQLAAVSDHAKPRLMGATR